jgi:PTS system ascorbate-specific IIA component
MIGVLVIAHEHVGESLRAALVHVLGAPPPQLDVLSVAAGDDPLALLPRAQAMVVALDTGEGVVVLCDLYGASPCNLAVKLAQPGHIEVVAGVSLPMLVRTFTYRNHGLPTLVKKAVSGGCEGVLHVTVDPAYAATRG